MREVGGALGPATQGGPPETIIYGKTGTGKSLVTRCTTRKAHQKARENGHSLQYSYVDCSDYQTEAKASRELAKELRDNLGVDVSIPRVGISASDYRDIAWELLDEHDIDSYVVILDEILRSLSRVRYSGKSEAHVGVICISNKIEYRDRLNERVNSSLQDNELFFHPYNTNLLRNILENRRDAFSDGVLESDVIPKAAALAAQEHGDARKAVDILYEAGRLAEKAGDGTVTVEHVDEAQTEAEINRFQELISGTTPHVKYALRALALLTENTNRNVFRTHEIYEYYKRLVRQKGGDSLSEDRVYRLLKEQSSLGITESNHTGGGLSEGSYLKHRLIGDPQVVTKALNAE